ncbi:anti-sigma B factor antagonist [Jatrophihabitans sp. GAS493]|uniref:STAS domain-containing protein n=1 Tax=Jatrophihabitans sp. GAS493 TaxID=1907575 RepID=UPI000BBF4356|nr:STAS domain-containing protein [Jatrophihabitans sp. GAS493]SOD72058.1 anti-sigma B factor antagonist [Jatrophihabitans sp. GAS493]
MEISLNTAVTEVASVLDVRGDVDFYSAPALRERLTDLLEEGERPVIVDLSAVGFIDSTGLGALVAALNLANERARTLSIVANQDRVTKLFRITGLDGVFAISDSVEGALAGVGEA